mgnify:CR=1 FL=1
MPITESAKKALRQSKRRAVFNRRLKKKAKKLIRAFKKRPTAEGLKKSYSALDKAAKKNVFHKNKTARLKSQLAKKLTATAPSKKKAPKKKKSGAKVMKTKKKS